MNNDNLLAEVLFKICNYRNNIGNGGTTSIHKLNHAAQLNFISIYGGDDYR